MATEKRDPNLNDTTLFPPPSKIPRLTPNPTPVAIDLPLFSPLTLGLELGLNGTSVSSLARKPIFTFMQMQELEHQSLIYKYMAGGLPVPLQLVLPIWKSVAAATNCGGHHYHSFLGCGGLCLDYRNSLEPEPGRCRRTDGKKWRCSRAIVPNQKYCERHMHRGRNRSRKQGEAGSGGGGGNGFDDLMPAVFH